MTKLFLLISILATHAQAGVINGGGGKGVLCANPDGTRTVESLDRYEARVVWRYRVPESKDFDSEFLRIMSRAHEALNASEKGPAERYTPEIHAAFQLAFKKFQAEMNFLPAGTHLRPTDDAGEVVVPPANCSLVQIIHYLDETDESGAILVDQEYWQMLSPQDQVALFFHELFYKGLRNDGALNSLLARKIVGRLVSSESYPSRYSPLWNAPRRLRCLGKSSDDQWSSTTGLAFFVIPFYNDAEKHLGSLLVFDDVDGDAVQAPTTALSYFPIETWQNLPGHGISGGENLSINSFLGHRSAELIVDSRANPIASGQLTGRGRWNIGLTGEAPENHWRMVFAKGGQSHEVEFQCFPVEGN